MVAHNGGFEAQNGGVEAQNKAAEGLLIGSSKIRIRIRNKENKEFATLPKALTSDAALSYVRYYRIY